MAEVARSLLTTLAAGCLWLAGVTLVIHRCSGRSSKVILRTMWSVLWSAIRHPFTTTYIDAETGRIIR